MSVPILESAYVKEGYPNTNYNNLYLEANWNYTKFLIDISLIKVNLAAIPPGAKIKTAKLRLYCTRLVSQYNDSMINLYGTDGAWSESTVTWNTAPGGFGEHPGTATELSPGITFEGVNKWVELPFNQTGLDWLSNRVGGPTTLIVAPWPVNYNFETRFYSSRYSPSAPQLLITYETLPTKATATVKGKCTAGYPPLSMELTIYKHVNGGLVLAKTDFGVIEIGRGYEVSTIVTGAGIHQVYGRMILRNVIGGYLFETPTKSFELG